MAKSISKDAWLNSHPGTLPRTSKKKKSKALTGPMEEDIQGFAEEYLELKGIKYIHIPDSAYKSRGNKALKGIPDLLIFNPISEKYNLALLLELKRKNGQLRQSQREWCRNRNVIVRLADTKTDVKLEIDEFMNTNLIEARYRTD